MDFGKLPNLKGVDLSLPADHPQTTRVLKKLTGNGNPQLFLGCAKWGRKEWLGTIYPEGTKEKEFLENYVKHFNSIELNATHYRLFKSEVVAGWRDKASSEFKFCPKFHRQITHLKRLKDVEEFTQYYYNVISTFEDRLGVCLLQMPERFTPNTVERLMEFIIKIPKEIPVSLELRHERWFDGSPEAEDLCTCLENEGRGTVITDTAGRRDCVHQRLTNDTAFIRFVGNNRHQTDYDRIDEWVKRIKDWIGQGLNQIYFFMHQPDETFSPEMSGYVSEKFIEAGLEAKKPQFL